MRTFGLIGFPLSHSFSQKYFTEKFRKENITDCEFKNFPVEDINSLPSIIKVNPTLCGLSITTPHKEKVISLLNKVSQTANEIEAVNCIKIDKQNQLLVGYNTDCEGFEESLKPLLQPHHTKALILGTGGAAKAVAHVLDRLKIKFRFVSRDKTRFSFGTPNERILGFSVDLFGVSNYEYEDIPKSKISEYTLIINATPLGMFPNVNECPNIPYDFLSPEHLLYDLTYNPEESLFLKKGKEKGAQIKNGLEMLHLQAEKAWEIWNS
jgi:shikimate dehydrogenase